MDDKDEIDEARGAEDALRPERPGGERKGEGETGPRGATSNRHAIGNPVADMSEDDGNDQTGDRSEAASRLGGPVRPRGG
jgi:hypothetical protein